MIEYFWKAKNLTEKIFDILIVLADLDLKCFIWKCHYMDCSNTGSMWKICCEVEESRTINAEMPEEILSKTFTTPKIKTDGPC